MYACTHEVMERLFGEGRGVEGGEEMEGKGGEGRGEDGRGGEWSGGWGGDGRGGVPRLQVVN